MAGPQLAAAAVAVWFPDGPPRRCAAAVATRCGIDRAGRRGLPREAHHAAHDAAPGQAHQRRLQPPGRGGGRVGATPWRRVPGARRRRRGGRRGDARGQPARAVRGRLPGRAPHGVAAALQPGLRARGGRVRGGRDAAAVGAEQGGRRPPSVRRHSPRHQYERHAGAGHAGEAAGGPGLPRDPRLHAVQPEGQRDRVRVPPAGRHGLPGQARAEGRAVQVPGQGKRPSSPVRQAVPHPSTPAPPRPSRAGANCGTGSPGASPSASRTRTAGPSPSPAPPPPRAGQRAAHPCTWTSATALCWARGPAPHPPAAAPAPGATATRLLPPPAGPRPRRRRTIHLWASLRPRAPTCP